MIYVILYLRRHPLGDIRIMAHPLTADNEIRANEMCLDVGKSMKAPAWIVVTEKPDIRPQLKLVEEPKIEGDALIIQQ